MKLYKVMHVMLGTGMSSMEGVFQHYNIALSEFCDVISVIDKSYHNKDVLLNTSCNVIELNKRFGVLSSISQVRKAVKQHETQIVIAHGPSALNLTTLSFLKAKKIAVRHNFFSSKLAAIHWRLQSDVNIAVNRRIVSDIGGAKTHLVYNTVELSPISIVKHSTFTSPIKIGFFGKIVHQKGIQFLIKALGLLINKKNLNCELIIGGDGKYVRALRHLSFLYGLDDRVKFIGYVKNKERFLENIDIFCLPSLRESFGRVLLDSMARGVPVVGSDIPGIHEIISHEDNGLLFTPGDYHDLADKIEELIINPHRRHSYMHSALMGIKKFFTIDRLRDDLKSILSSV